MASVGIRPQKVKYVKFSKENKKRYQYKSKKKPIIEPFQDINWHDGQRWPS